jgi:hypothetical protein
MRVLALIVLGACVLLFIGGLVFRAMVYWRLPIAAGDPYGIADIVEYGLYMILLVAAVAAFLLGAVLVIVRKLGLARIGVALIVVSAVATLAYSPLHTFVARLTVPSRG